MRSCLLALAIAAALALAACGGSSDEDSGDETLVKEEFIAQADEICQADDEQTDELVTAFDEAADAGRFDEAAGHLREALAIADETVGEVRALPPPDEDAEQLDEVFAIFDEQVAATNKLIDLLESGQVEQVQAAAVDLVAVQERQKVAAAEFGFELCGQGRPAPE